MCHSRTHHQEREQASSSGLRASDSERERTVSTLRNAAAEGRLALSELEERLANAWSALTRGELAGLTRDLDGGQFRAPRGTSWLRSPAIIWILPVTLWLISSIAWHAFGL
ncbi:MAG TPA: DUF1707 domain-containing protein [Solirubrobacteraceae bacterium]|jgi:hypothetical protein|nr:DUF1707 domain-containing protein [Solirubrobacteraceae bacterium]